MYQPHVNPNPVMTQELLKRGTFASRPVRVIDGGSRRGVEGHWTAYGPDVEVLAFEPDPEECAALNEAAAMSDLRQRHFPVALGRSAGDAVLHVARFPDSSSLLPVNDVFVNRFAMGDYLKQERDLVVATTDLDGFLEAEGIADLDFVKLDIEGSELAVLEGGQRALQVSVLGVSVEVWFQTDHVGRPLFADIDSFLRSLGFALWDLRQVNRWRRRTDAGAEYSSWIDSGQLMYANALYFKDLPNLLQQGAVTTPVETRSVLLLASLAEVFCYTDFAIEVLDVARSASAIDIDPSPLIDRLREQAIAPSTPWQAGARRVFRAALPAPLRRRLARTFQRLVSE